MASISRAIANRYYDRAFVMATSFCGSPTIAAAFLIESGVDVDELPIAAKRAILEARSEAA